MRTRMGGAGAAGMEIGHLLAGQKHVQERICVDVVLVVRSQGLLRPVEGLGLIP